MALPSALEPYPQLDLAVVAELFRIVRSGELRSELKLAIKCTSHLIDAGLGLLVGEPDGIPPLIADAKLTEAGRILIGNLEDSVRASLDDGPPPELVGEDAKAIDWTKVEKIFRLLLTILPLFIAKD